jgi:hypothetical protein
VRKKVTPESLKKLMQQLAQRAQGPGSVFLTGGATAMMFGFRDQTVDIDIKLDPEPKGVFEAIAELKQELQLNIELASPDDFIPAPSDWRSRSILIETINNVQFFHYDLSLQALSKLERGHEQDLLDVKALIDNGFLTPMSILERFSEIQPLLIRYPALDAKDFEQRVKAFLKDFGKDE